MQASLRWQATKGCGRECLACRHLFMVHFTVCWVSHQPVHVMLCLC